MKTHRQHLLASVVAVASLLFVWHELSPAQQSAEDHGQPDYGQPGRLSLEHQRQHALFYADQEPTHELQRLGATPCVDGFADIYPCENVDLLAFLPLAEMGGGQGNDIWGWTDPVTGKEYAIMGRTSGTSFVDVSDPENPIYLGNLPSHTVNSLWRDIKTHSGHAFIVSEAGGHGLQIFDLSALRDVTIPPVTFSETTHYNGFGNAHNVVINEDSGFAYAVGTNTCSGGLHMVDIRDPLSPMFAGCVANDGYVHDAQCVVYRGSDPDYLGREICFNSSEDTVTIVDVTNKANPLQLSRTGYPGRGYTHQAWLSADHEYLLMNDELDESRFGHNTRTRIFDVTDLDAPALIGFHEGTTTAIDHNLYVVGDEVYQANYRAGLTVLDASALADSTLTELGFFDVYPSSDSPNFNGAWSVYPFFASGSVVVSGIEQGLFVLRLAERAEVTIGLSGRPNPVSVGEPFTLSWSLTNPGASFEGHILLALVTSELAVPLAFVPVTVPTGLDFEDAPIATFDYPALPTSGWLIALTDTAGKLVSFDLEIVFTTAPSANQGQDEIRRLAAELAQSISSTTE